MHLATNTPNKETVMRLVKHYGLQFSAALAIAVGFVAVAKLTSQAIQAIPL